MTIPLYGKIIMVVVTLGVIAGVTTVIVLSVQSDEEVTTTSTTTSEPTPEPIPGIQAGVGIADMTGPCVGIRFMGYASLTQVGSGLHLRQFARSFIFIYGNTRVVYVSAEVQSVGLAVRREVVLRLQRMYGLRMYTLRNVIIAGTHTHSAPGGHLVDFLLDISILGFSRETFNAYVEGIVRSVARAHNNIEPAYLFYGTTNVTGASINRSPNSYKANPESERDLYDSDLDNVMTQVRIEDRNGNLKGAMTWFSVHATSMNNTNTLVSSDNLGYAAYRMEKELNNGTFAGKGDIVTGFFAANLGDASPNTQGPRCEKSGNPCDNQHDVCELFERCFARGPGDNMFDSVKIIGTKVYEGAMEILKTPGEKLEGKVAVAHQFVNMAVAEGFKYDPVQKSFNNTRVRGCTPAMGYSFAAGTTDGDNTLNVTQGMIEGNALLDTIAGLVVGKATEEDKECHAPKPILLATGRATFPFPWHPNIVSATVVWLGGLAILGVPGEPTTMAGRRMADVVGSVMKEHDFEPKVVVTALTNEYAHYVTTHEEYRVQRYEGASVIYGPHTLDIFLNKFRELTTAIIEDRTVLAGPNPPNHRGDTISLILPVLQDTRQIGREYGTCMREPAPQVLQGESVQAYFTAGNPRNDLRQESSYFVIERADGDNWVPVVNDADFDTKFSYELISRLFRTSQVRVEWDIPEDAIPGVHRIQYYGASKNLVFWVSTFTGQSSNFTIIEKEIETTTESITTTTESITTTTEYITTTTESITTTTEYITTTTESITTSTISESETESESESSNESEPSNELKILPAVSYVLN